MGKVFFAFFFSKMNTFSISVIFMILTFIWQKKIKCSWSGLNRRPMMRQASNLPLSYENDCVGNPVCDEWTNSNDYITNEHVLGMGVRTFFSMYWKGPLISILLSFVSSKPFSDWKLSENSQKAMGFLKILSHWNFIFRKFSKLL